MSYLFEILQGNFQVVCYPEALTDTNDHDRGDQGDRQAIQRRKLASMKSSTLPTIFHCMLMDSPE